MAVTRAFVLYGSQCCGTFHHTQSTKVAKIPWNAPGLDRQIYSMKFTMMVEKIIDYYGGKIRVRAKGKQETTLIYMKDSEGDGSVLETPDVISGDV